MKNTSLMILIGAALLFVVLLTQWGRFLTGVALICIIAVSGYRTFVRSYACPRTDTVCSIEVQPVWAGWCFPSDGTGLVTMNGTYHLTAQPGADARATCLDIRVLR